MLWTSSRTTAGLVFVSPPTGSFPVWQLHLGLLGYLERVVNVYAEVADCAFERAVTE